MKLSVVVPAYNEAHRILPSLERIFAYLHAQHADFDVLVVDDGSTDDTVGVTRQRFGAREPLRIVSCGANRGKGYAVRQGAAQARGDIILFSDADLSTPIEELEKMLPLLEQGYDMVIGSRAHAQADIREHQPFYREGAGKLFNLLVRIVVGGPFRDTQCGFKLFRREAIVPILPHLQIDRWAFDVELIAVAQALGLKVAEVPVTWSNSPTSTVGFWQGGRAFLDLVRIRRRARRLSVAGLDTARDRVEVARGSH
jgi:dolichyl-phosphate beta-glucosyltransferase